MAVIGSSMTAMEDALNIRPGMMMRHDPPDPTVSPFPDSVWFKTLSRNTETTADKLNAWYARLEGRVAQIEADDAVMGKKETKRWMDELAAFKADLS